METQGKSGGSLPDTGYMHILETRLKCIGPAISVENTDRVLKDFNTFWCWIT